MRQPANKIDSGGLNADTSDCVKPDLPEAPSLYSQEPLPALPIVVLGEVLWDLFEDSRQPGGAPLNFGANARRLGHPVTLISALGADELGERATQAIAGLGLDASLLQTTSRFPTGIARVELLPGGRTHFTIPRPAAYDAVEISQREVEILRRTEGADSPELVQELLREADVVKLNEDELRRVQQFTGLPFGIQAFCREAAGRYGWQAVGVTLGDRGCAIYAQGQFVEAGGHPVEVVDTVGAGDAFAAAFLHGFSSHLPLPETAAFANRLAAQVVSRHPAIPDWTPQQTVTGHAE